MKRILYVILVVVLGWSACVPNKKVVYLQDENYPTDYVKDSLLASYALTEFEYRLQPNDVVRITIGTVLKTDEFNFFDTDQSRNQNFGGGGGMQGQNMLLSGDVIDQNGYVSLPVVGKVKIDSLTVEEAQDKIKQEVSRFIDVPDVKLRLLSYRYTVLGEIGSPGQQFNYLPKLSIFEAISQSGDLTNFADRSNIKLVRVENDTAKVYYLNLLEEEYLASDFYYVRPNDLYIVPPLKSKPVRTYTLSNIGFTIGTISGVLALILIFVR